MTLCSTRRMRMPMVKHGKRLFRTPKAFSTTTRVLQCARLYLRQIPKYMLQAKVD